MIVSHKHKFIFIKTVKTAGTSIEVDLNKVLGPEDIATPIFPPVDWHSPQNFEYRKWGVLRRQLYNHMPARDVLRIVGPRVFEDYFVFCVEREPIDKCVSHFSMIRNSPDHNSETGTLTFDEYIERAEFPVDADKYTTREGALLVNRILRYERLEEELREVGVELGIEISLKTRAKSGFRQDIQLSPAQKEKIYRAFSTSNNFTGYTLQ
ncbi:MAG: hypothetical protein AAGC56_03165 [Pseudomonadota bacterium]